MAHFCSEFLSRNIVPHLQGSMKLEVFKQTLDHFLSAISVCNFLVSIEAVPQTQALCKMLLRDQVEREIGAYFCGWSNCILESFRIVALDRPDQVELLWPQLRI